MTRTNTIASTMKRRRRHGEDFFVVSLISQHPSCSTGQQLWASVLKLWILGWLKFCYPRSLTKAHTENIQFRAYSRSVQVSGQESILDG